MKKMNFFSFLLVSGLILIVLISCNTTSANKTAAIKTTESEITEVETTAKTESETSVQTTKEDTEIADKADETTPVVKIKPYEGPVKIYGYVKDENGKPIQDMSIAFDAFESGDQGNVKTDSSGYYEKQFDGAPQYIVSVNPGPAIDIDKYSFPSGYLSEKKLVIPTKPDVRLDFTVRDGGTLWLKAYNESGKEMSAQDLLDSSKIGAYQVGTLPYGETIQAKYSGFPMFWGWIKDSNKNTPCLLLPPDEPVEIWMLWRLPEVGTTFLHADNEGKGFIVGKGDLVPINLLYEFARTEYREVLKLYQKSQVTSFMSFGTVVYQFSKDITVWLDNAKQNMIKAESFQEKDLEKDSAIYSYKVLSNVIKAREQIILEKAQQDIERIRKSDIAIILTDENGNKLSNAAIEYQQVSHNFIFSTGWPSPQQYESLRTAGIDYSFFEAWWGEVETSDGVYNFPDSALKQQQEAGFGYVMETGLWLRPDYPPAIPKFATSLTPEELSNQAYQYSYDYVSHYNGEIKMYAAILEPDLTQAYKFTLDELINITRFSALGAKDADKDLPVYILITHPIFGSIFSSGVYYSIVQDQFGRTLPEVSYFESPVNSGYEFIKALKKEGVDFNTVGLEYYFGAPMPTIDLGLFEKSLDINSTLSKTIFIGEISYPALDEYPGTNRGWVWYGGWHEGFNEKTQADWARSTLTIAFSKPYVIGYQWGTTSDGPKDYYLVGNGLFKKDGVTPRPVLHAIGDLIKSWTTDGSGITDNNGLLNFHGFGGDYELKITTEDGQIFNTRVNINEGQDNVLNLAIDKKPPVFKSVSIEPATVKNGDTIDIIVDAGEDDLAVTSDISQLDLTRTEPVVFKRQSDGLYKASVAISLGNTAADGIKKVIVNAVDSWGNIGTKTVDVEFKGMAAVLDAVPPDDSFDGTVLDETKWKPDTSSGGVIKQDGRLILTTDSKQSYSSARIESVWEFKGDFDVQIDFQIGEGWKRPSMEHLDGAFLGVDFSGEVYHITRLRSTGEDKLFVWSSTDTLKGEKPTNSITGKYRLIRTGTILTLLYDIGDGWQELATVTVPSEPGKIYIGNGSINASQAFTTYFDNFRINSGITTYKVIN